MRVTKKIIQYFTANVHRNFLLQLVDFQNIQLTQSLDFKKRVIYNEKLQKKAGQYRFVAGYI